MTDNDDSSRILVVQGHPDPAGGHLCHALADAYVQGARQRGHAVRRVEVAQLDFPLLRSQHDWQHGSVPEALAPVQQDLVWARHLVMLFPLWMGDMPALLKGFIEQVARPGLGGMPPSEGGMPPKALKGRSARLVVTMGMPALVYRYYFRAHSLKSLERNILGMVGIAPVHETLVGLVDRLDDAQTGRWMARLRKLGRDAS
ncbi:MAG: NAD(P)H-dependent oxidoreductase [Rubrivivax sp.]|nr:NAD(P)H-dependent oxidoreductase [Rubrivivax sp.]MDH5339530.1 NAD(P)H-dependent oxidoreductase [Rubrivivax sp.]